MREFEKSELFRHKCHICGSLNKRMIPVTYSRKNSAIGEVPYGYLIHCCNCGHVEQFYTPPKNLNMLLCGCLQVAKLTEQKCYAINACPHTECPLYGTYVPDKNSGYEDEQGKGDDNSGNSNNKHNCGMPNCGCGDDCNCKSNLGVYGDSKSNGQELTVKVDPPRPKFV